jgi:uncharacterized repeat protein (TIGR01451 family)
MSLLRMDKRNSLMLALLAGMMLVFSCPGPVEGGGGNNNPSNYTFYVDITSYPDMETFSLSVFTGSEEVYSNDFTLADLDSGKGTIPASAIPGGSNTFVIEASDANGYIYYRGEGAYTLGASKTSFEITLEEIKVRPLSITQTTGSSVKVTISTLTAGAQIYYTLDGTTPIPGEAYEYAGPFDVMGDLTVTAIGSRGDLLDSPVAQLNVDVDSSKSPVPVASPAAGTYNTSIDVSLSGSGTIFYTLDDSTPDTSSTPFSSAFSITESVTLKAINVDSGKSPSDVITAEYVIDNGAGEKASEPSFSLASGTYFNAKSLILAADTGNTVYYRINSGNFTQYIAPLNLDTTGTYTVSAYATSPGKLDSDIVTREIIIDLEITPVTPKPVINPNNGTYQEAQDIVISAASGAEITYQINGGSVEVYDNPISLDVNGSYTIQAWAQRSGEIKSEAAQASILIEIPLPKTDTPMISPSSGTFEDSVEVTISGEGNIFYTIDNSPATQSSIPYLGPFTLEGAGNKVVRAVAIAQGKDLSDEASASYQITSEETGDLTLIISVSNPEDLDIIFSGLGELTDTALTINSNILGASAYEWKVDGVTVSTSSSVTLSPAAYSNGDHTLTLIVTVDGAPYSSSQTFTVNQVSEKTSDPTVLPLSGTYESPINVSANGEGSLYYSLDGNDPTESSLAFPGDGLELGEGTYDLRVVAKASGKTLSNIVRRSYTVETVVPKVIVYAQAASAPSIWLWTDETAISTELNWTWPGESMESDGAGWWKYELPAEYIPLSSDLKILFNGINTTEHSIASTAWNTDQSDTDAWTYQDPRVPEAPTVTLTPSSGSILIDTDRTINVELNDNGSTITSTVYSINGGPDQTLIGTSFLVDASGASVGDTLTYSVRATNSIGSTTASGNLSVTDEIITSTDFHWDNATVYFVIVDRFFDGNPANNNSYGRPTVDASGKNIGTFHGGDIAGLTQKLNDGFFTDLGVNAIWITAPYEQIHGFVGGGDNGDFAHYAYHGYYPLDFTNMDANMGTFHEFETFVDTAHEQGIRIVMDIVMNHAGYQTILDMDKFDFGGKKAGFDPNWTSPQGNWGDYHNFIDYDGQASEWLKWWGADWVRAGLPGYTPGGTDEETRNLDFLPDFKTESENSVGLPPILANKSDYQGSTGSKKVREWLIEWLTDWVRDYGIDGFRVDTAKHVQTYIWADLKNAAQNALQDWRAANPTKPGADWSEDFWTTAEVFGHGLNKSNYHTTGQFDSVINFGFKNDVNNMINNPSAMVNTWNNYANAVNTDSSWNGLSYISSHDTGSVFYNGDNNRQKEAGTALILLPGGVQIFYGDEMGRNNGDGGSDPDQGSRSSIDWNKYDNDVHQHWKKLGQFRRDNIAVGAGQQSGIGSSSGSAVSRTWSEGSLSSQVAIVVGASGSTSVNVSSLWNDGTTLRNAYDGTTAVVSGGNVTFNAGSNGVILIEAAE